MSLVWQRHQRFSLSQSAKDASRCLKMLHVHSSQASDASAKFVKRLNALKANQASIRNFIDSSHTDLTSCRRTRSHAPSKGKFENRDRNSKHSIRPSAPHANRSCQYLPWLCLSASAAARAASYTPRQSTSCSRRAKFSKHRSSVSKRGADAQVTARKSKMQQGLVCSVTSGLSQHRKEPS